MAEAPDSVWEVTDTRCNVLDGLLFHFLTQTWDQWVKAAMEKGVLCFRTCGELKLSLRQSLGLLPFLRAEEHPHLIAHARHLFKGWKIPCSTKQSPPRLSQTWGGGTRTLLTSVNSDSISKELNPRKTKLYSTFLLLIKFPRFKGLKNKQEAIANVSVCFSLFFLALSPSACWRRPAEWLINSPVLFCPFT